MTPGEFEYLVEDIVEIKMEKSGSECRQWVSFLIGKNTGEISVGKVPGFLIGDTLLVLKDKERGFPKRLVCVEAETSGKLEVGLEGSAAGNGII